MTKRSPATLICIILAVVGFCIFHKRTENKPVSINEGSQTQDQDTVLRNSQNPTLAQAVPNPITNTVASKPATSDAIVEYLQKIKADPQYDGKQPINFYGRVVDENGDTVIGAKIHFSWNGISPTGTSQTDIVSDGSGFFSLTGEQGKYLYVTVSKEGYYSGGNARGEGFEYANPANGLFTPDQGNPVVFQLRKKGAGEALVHGVQLFGFQTNGTVQYLDLLQGKNTLVPPGDLAVQFTRGARNDEAKYDWSVIISVPDGGLLESDDEFMFEAPTNGYQPSIEIHETADNPRWTSAGKLRFYFTSRNASIYGRAEATIYPHYQKGAAIDLNYYVNPAGSPYLEPK
jgi:hypothetical protein